MTDARIPERWLNDRRLLRLSDPGFRLFVMSLMWSVSNRTDGMVYDDDLPLMPTVDAARAPELAKYGVWVRERDFWVIADYAGTQTSAHDLEVLENARRREREKKRRQRARAAPDVPGDSPEARSPGTAQDRTGQARTGSSTASGDSWPEVRDPGAST